MRIKYLCGVLLLVFICDVLANEEINKTLEEVQTTTDSVLREPTHCQSDSDCHHLGKCEPAEDGAKSCKCKSGTSGDLCEKVDECVDNPVKCGVQKDVSCAFDAVLEQAVCKCDNESKTYVQNEERCMSPCSTSLTNQCKNGICRNKIGDQTFCACLLGSSGDYCEIIDECFNKDVDCGTEPDVECKLDNQGRAYCKCTNPELGFDYDEKICKSCSKCGVNAISGSGCEYKNGIRKCYCKVSFYSSSRGVCEDCECGPSWGCKFENGTRICDCFYGYAIKGDRCERCHCGLYQTKCTFSDGQKVCTCHKGFIQSGPDGICTPKCNATLPCENGGRCVQNVCSCLKGTGGPLCKTVDYCSKGGCGQADCLYNVTAQAAYCTCINDRLVFDDVARKCRACDCGYDARSCSYEKGKKKCTCYNNYEDKLGTCTYCRCKEYYSTLKGCRFDDRGNIKCKCSKGYAQVDDECLRCDCGANGNCTLDRWRSKSCVCDKGYAEDRGTCQECDCGENGWCGFNSYGKKECHCEAGYQSYEGTCKECNCGYNGICKFDSFGNKECVCRSRYGKKSGVCTLCDCYPGTSCVFSEYLSNDKTCICPLGYANYMGSCRVCDCGLSDSNCTMEYGIKHCQCPKGYEAVHSFLDVSCKDIDECLHPWDNGCPPSTKCVNKPGSYECVCKEGYEQPNIDYDIKTFGCQDIDECVGDVPACNSHHAVCINTLGSYRCDCTAGYTVKIDSYAEKYNYCVENDRPWRTATIVVGSLLGVVILALLLSICSIKCQDL